MNKDKTLQVELFANNISSFFGHVSFKEFSGPGKKEARVYVLKWCCLMIKAYFKISHESIGKLFEKDHATCRYHCITLIGFIQIGRDVKILPDYHNLLHYLNSLGYDINIIRKYIKTHKVQQYNRRLHARSIRKVDRIKTTIYG